MAQDDLVDAVDGFCESMAFSSQQIDRVFEVAQQLKIPVKLHADQLSDGGGAALAARYQALSADHLEFSNLQGLQAMSDQQTVAVLLPGAYYCLGQGQKPNVEVMRQLKIPMAVATDCNPGSSPTTDLRLMAHMACHLFGLTAMEALAGVTTHAASALGLGCEWGQIQPGSQANFLVWPVESVESLILSLGEGIWPQRVMAESY